MQIPNVFPTAYSPLSYTVTLSVPHSQGLAGGTTFPADMLALEQPEMPANLAADFLNALLFSLGETLGGQFEGDQGAEFLAQEALAAAEPMGATEKPCCCSSTPSARPSSNQRPTADKATRTAPEPAKPSSQSGDRKAAPAKKAEETKDKSSDPELAAKIDAYLDERNSPGAGSGNLFVENGKKHNVDPLLLLAIAGHETGYGTLGIGANGMLGVGAYDDNPENALNDPQFAGIANQLNVGGRTFAHWRQHFGGSPDDSIQDQVVMVGQKWATDPNWHNGVMRHYAAIQDFFGA